MRMKFALMAVLAIVALVVGCTAPIAPATNPAPGSSTPSSPALGTSTPAPTSGGTVSTPKASPTSQPPKVQSTGTIEVRVTDAPPQYGDIKEIRVEVVNSGEEGVAVHRAGVDEGGEGQGEWIKVPITGDNPFELLALKNGGLEALLGEAIVPTGKYTQIRLTVKEVKIVFEGATPEASDDITKIAILPSGTLKFVRPFDVVEGGEPTVLVLDFDAAKSVHITGQGEVMVKPVVKLSIQQGKAHELATVTGTINDVDEEESTVSIIPTGKDEEDAIVLDVTPKTEITLDDEEATLGDLAELIGEEHTVTASYYLDNLKAVTIGAETS